MTVSSMPKVARDLLAVLAGDRTLASLSDTTASAVLAQARKSLLLGSLAARTDLDTVPSAVRAQLIAGQRTGETHRRVLAWELNRLALIFAETDVQPLLLKGAAYYLRGLPLAQGRLVSDVDILVERDTLARAERLLTDADFIEAELDEYDQRYYRTWMHELPPLRHRHRATVVDVHHTILPLTGRVQPDAAALVHDAEALPGTPFMALNPLDTVLHCAAHLFQDGDLNNRLRDLVDLDGLLRWACPDADSARALLERARLHQLDASLAYGLRYCHRWLGTPFHAPLPRIGVIRRSLMDALLPPSLLPTVVGPAGPKARVARKLLYMRSHWLRMPPLQLTAHLTRKALRRERSESAY